MESFLLLCDAALMVAAVILAVRDDRRSPRERVLGFFSMDPRVERRPGEPDPHAAVPVAAPAIVPARRRRASFL